MIGLAYIAAAEIFAEISISLGKYEAKHKHETLYAIGFLNALWATIFLIALGFYMQDAFVFSAASLPTFLLRAVFEVALMFVNLHAILAADRSTFSFLRILTIPLLLVVDLWIGYAITSFQIIGICLIVVALVVLLLNHGLSRRGKLLTLASALIAVVTISLYKYNVTHFNSVIAEQVMMHFIMLIAIVVAGAYYGHENVFRYLTKPTFIVQSVAAGIANVLLSFGFALGHPSVMMAGKRSFEIVAAMVAGRAYFHEKHIVLKLSALALISVGIILTLL